MIVGKCDGFILFGAEYKLIKNFGLGLITKLSIQPPCPTNLVIPKHDYKLGTNIISISQRKNVNSITNHFLLLYTDFIVKTEKKYPGLQHMSDWEVIFTATIQALKVKEGVIMLNKLKNELNNNSLSKKM